MIDQRHELARRLAARFGDLAPVEAVALTGSASSGTADEHSDIDLYVYLNADLVVGERKAVAAPYGDDAEFDNHFWGTANSWHDAKTGIRVEGLYWDVRWIEGEIDRILRRCEPSIGYSTAFWYSVRNGRILFDRKGWLHRLQADAQQPYPEQLRQAIIANNYPILRRMSSSYLQQIELAQSRGDTVSLCHRCTTLLESYFDILLALNRQPHPGEKRLISFAEQFCPLRPPNLRAQVEALIAGLSGAAVVPLANALIDGLDDLLRAEGFDLTQV